MVAFSSCGALLQRPVAASIAHKPARLHAPGLASAARCRVAATKLPKPAAAAGASAAADRSQTSSSLASYAAPSIAASLLPLLTARSAFAAVDEAAIDAAYAAANDSGPTDVVVSLLAGVVFVLLLVVTGGVAYINISGWLDARQEKKDREGPAVSSSVASAAAGSGSDDEAAVQKRVRIKREKRGFGDRS